MRRVRPVLNSGNFLLESDLPSTLLEAQTESVVTAFSGRPTTCMVRTAESCSLLLRSNPFPEVAASTPALLTVAFLKRAPAKAAWVSLKGPWPGGETVEPFGTHAFVHYPQGQGRSKLTVKVLESRLGVALTVRNWNTVRRLEAFLRSGWE